EEPMEIEVVAVEGDPRASGEPEVTHGPGAFSDVPGEIRIGGLTAFDDGCDSAGALGGVKCDVLGGHEGSSTRMPPWRQDRYRESPALAWTARAGLVSRHHSPKSAAIPCPSPACCSTSSGSSAAGSIWRSAGSSPQS